MVACDMSAASGENLKRESFCSPSDIDLGHGKPDCDENNTHQHRADIFYSLLSVTERSRSTLWKL